jgi:hypothetical protein
MKVADMSRFQSWLSGFSSTGIAVVLSLIVIAVHGVLLAGSLIRFRTAESLAGQVNELRTNMEQAIDIREAAQAELQGELERAQAEVQRLEGQVPRPQTGFAVYPEAFRLALQQGLDMLRVQRAATETESTVLGQVRTEEYTIDVAGAASSCVDYFETIESSGGVTVALDDIAVDPVVETCSLGLHTVVLESQ